MERIYHHYEKWEDYKNGMYNECREGRSERVKRAAEILGNPKECEEAMNKVINEWKKSTEYNLSNIGVNRKAWLGQAACSCYANIHEDETREAWGIMTEEQRVKANKIAQNIINRWQSDLRKQDEHQISIFNDWGCLF